MTPRRKLAALRGFLIDVLEASTVDRRTVEHVDIAHSFSQHFGDVLPTWLFRALSKRKVCPCKTLAYEAGRRHARHCPWRDPDYFEGW